VIDDQTLALKANAVLTKDRGLWRNCHINTLTYNNSILLVGQAPSETLKERASKLLTTIFKSEQIYNQINIGDPIPFTTRTKDSWITTQVKGKILANKNIGINRTKIITEDGVVYLMGILTKEEEDIASAIASQTQDVKQVIKITTEHERQNRS
jgi:osmotically-inducible protein OsmY